MCRGLHDLSYTVCSEGRMCERNFRKINFDRNSLLNPLLLVGKSSPGSGFSLAIRMVFYHISRYVTKQNKICYITRFNISLKRVFH